jgi:hypothetical protein
MGILWRGCRDFEMDIYLFEVEDVFVIKKLGPVLYPGIKASPPGLTISVDEKIMLLFPDTQQVTTTIKSFPFINTTKYKGSVGIELHKRKGMENIPIGTLVYLVRDEA